MRIKPVYIWWLPVALFTPSVLIWTFVLSSLIRKFEVFTVPDWHALTHLYFPLLAAILGIGVPLFCLRRLRNCSARTNCIALALFLSVMLTWGIIDIRNENCQIRGHDYPNDPLIDGHRYYWHLYLTWYFLPYRAIHGYDFDAPRQH